MWLCSRQTIQTDNISNIYTLFMSPTTPVLMHLQRKKIRSRVSSINLFLSFFLFSPSSHNFHLLLSPSLSFLFSLSVILLLNISPQEKLPFLHCKHIRLILLHLQCLRNHSQQFILEKHSSCLSLEWIAAFSQHLFIALCSSFPLKSFLSLFFLSRIILVTT